VVVLLDDELKLGHMSRNTRYEAGPAVVVVPKYTSGDAREMVAKKFNHNDKRSMSHYVTK
jgi:hypothetical protein